MTKEIYSQQLRECFRSDFVSAEHFIQVVLEPLFHEITPLVENDMLTETDYAQYKTRGLQSVHKVAQISDGFNPIEVYDIVLQETTNIAVARVYIQQFVRSMAIPYSSAFLLFHYANPANREWRFSYLYKEDTNASITNAKRFTYLFGKDHTCRTAEERFAELFGQDNIEKQQLLDAFSVEALSKEFFTQYDAIYQRFCKYIEENQTLFGEEFRQDTTGKTTRDYVKKLLGRITFLCFLQKKRWLNNNIHFMRDLFYKATPEQQANFLDEVLEPLFFDCLNRQRPNDIFNTGVTALGEAHIPYLNGGLFERDKIDTARSQFPADYFRELFDFYEQYNFTIDENDPNDAEVGVDPEMLGKIFESQLEDNKDKGAFYTPKEIVQYMCRESLIAYLTNCASENTQHKFPREQTEASVRQLVQTPEQIAPKMNARQKEDFGKALRAVKICDPAIGSGAFPMGLLNELVRLRVSIDAWADKPNDIAALKREIIQNNIYGVDIEQGAIDIARLRFWLSIVVDETTPSPLPNFDYKFMQGNSLITTFGGEYINLDTKEQSHYKVEEMKKEKKALYELKQQYYTSSGEQKLELARQIKDTIIRLISMQLGYESRSWVASHAEQTSLFEEAKQLSFDDIIAQLPEEKKRVINLCKKLHAQLENKALPLETRAHTNIQFFDWRMMFTEVFDNDQPGFDIVIGNPPYIDSETMTKVMPELRELYAKRFSCAKGNWDIYITFMELALRMGRIASLITPDKWLSKPFGYEFRKQLMMKRLIKITHAGASVFSSATVDAIITLYNENSNEIHGCKFISAEDIKQLSVASMDSIQDPYYIDFLFSDQSSLIAKLDKLPKRIKDLYVSCEGACATSDAYKLVPLLNNSDSALIDNSTYYKLVNTGTIVKYAPLWGVKQITYLGNKLICPIVAKEDFNTMFGKTYILRAQRPKIIFKGLNLLDAFIDAKAEFIPGKTTLVICSEDIEKLKFLCAVINSKLIFRYVKIKYQSSSYCGGITFTSDMINLIPLPQITPAQQQPIIDLVDAILAKKQSNPQADTAAEEQQIDQLVYKLYDLTPEEIQLIENN